MCAECLEATGGFVHPLPAIGELELDTVWRRVYEPDLIGGEFADVFLLPDGRVLIMSGDVSGHGVRSATLAEGVRSGIRALALTGLSPARILETMIFQVAWVGLRRQLVRSRNDRGSPVPRRDLAGLMNAAAGT